MNNKSETFGTVTVQGHSPSFVAKDGDVLLPLPPDALERDDMGLYALFMRHLRCVPNSRMEIKILSALHFTSDVLGSSDAHSAKILVELGLRAPRAAFPADFLKYADAALLRKEWEIGGASEAIRELRQHWDAIGESPFAAFMGDYSYVNEEIVN